MRSWLGIVPDVMRNRALIPNLIGAAKLPAIYPFFELVEAGGLMAYAFDLVELNKRAANDIDAILRGANPGDIPFYQASKFELSINLKTSKSLGLTVRTILLASADKVIEKSRGLLRRMSPVVAQLGHAAVVALCPLLGAERKMKPTACVPNSPAAPLEISTFRSVPPGVGDRAAPYSSSPAWSGGSSEFCRRSRRTE
ncbi:hypothetical protein V1289_003097 [Bradyrhizobium sp. AZCC 2289]